MSDKIKLSCPRCKHKWEQLLDELEKMEIFYRGEKENQKRKVVKYRAQCPNDGTFVIVEVEED